MDDSKSYSFFKKVERLFHAPKIVEKFYTKLGCKDISSLVEENYGPAGKSPEAITGHPRCTETRKYVLDRLRIFVADQHNPMMDKVCRDYCAGNNFQVQVFPKMMVRRVLKFGGKEKSETCDTTAGYSLDKDNRFILAVVTGDLNYYEYVIEVCFDLPVNSFDSVANCVSMIFGSKYRASTATSLTTIYNSKLHVLMQQGYNGVFCFVGF